MITDDLASDILPKAMRQTGNCYLGLSYVHVSIISQSEAESTNFFQLARTAVTIQGRRLLEGSVMQ